MRNFKKVLALVLALAMAMTMFAGAISIPEKATDFDTLSAAGQEAYSVLSGLGIVKGYPDGTVGGAKIVTRAEMAKLIYVAKSGDVNSEAAFFGSATLPFKDYIDAWAVPYVAYASLNGIVAGYPDGTFKYNNPVTGVEAAKMLLVALGYEPTKDGLLGSQYYANTMRIAGISGLLKNVGGNMSTGMTRENAMIMVYNALYASKKNSTMTLGEEGFDLLDANAVLVANDQAALGAYWPVDSAKAGNYISATGKFVAYLEYAKAQSGQSRFVYKDYIKTNAANDIGEYEYRVITAAVDSDFDDLGTEYRVLSTRLANNYVSSEVRPVYAILGKSVNTNVETRKTAATVNYGNLKSMIRSEFVGTNVLNPDKTIYLNATAVHLVGNDNNKNAIFAGPAIPADGTIIKKTTAPVKYVDNNADGIVDSLLVAEYTLGTVAAKTDKDVIISTDNGSKTIKVADYKLTNGDIAVGDYVAFYKTDFTFIKKLAKVDASITGFDGKYTINGVKYERGDLETQRAKRFFDDKQYAISNTQYTFIMDEDANSHFIVDVLVNTNTKFEKYAVNLDDVNRGAVGTNFYKPFVRLYTEDNKIEIFSVATINNMLPYQFLNENKGNDENEIEANSLVSYVVDGTDVHLTIVGQERVGSSPRMTVAGAKLFDGVGTPGQAITPEQLAAMSGTYYDDDVDAKFNNDIKMWTLTGNKTVGNEEISFGASLADTNAAVIFARSSTSNDEELDGRGAKGWRAYAMNEFYGKNMEFITVTDNSEAVWIHTSYNSAKIVKAMKLELYDVPSIAIDTNSKIILANGLASYSLADGVYSYTINTFAPFGAEAAQVTYKSKTQIAADLFTKGNAYKIDLDANGFLVNFRQIALFGDNVESFIPTTMNFVTEFYKDSYGKTVIGISKENDKSTDAYIELAEGAVIYTTKKLGTTDCAGYDYYSLINNFQGIAERVEGITISAIYDASGKVSTAFINIGADKVVGTL